MSRLSGTIDDIGRMAPLINDMSKSITTLTTTADKVLSDMYAKVPSLKPIFIGAGGLIGIYLITGIIANIKSVHDA